jgi:hypothetical protein
MSGSEPSQEQDEHGEGGSPETSGRMQAVRVVGGGQVRVKTSRK